MEKLITKFTTDLLYYYVVLTLVFRIRLGAAFLGAKFLVNHKIDHFLAGEIRSHEEMRLSSSSPRALLSQLSSAA